MTELKAKYYDGKISSGIEVKLYFTATHKILVEAADFRQEYNLKEVNISSRLGNTPRKIYFPDGSMCETDNNDIIDQILAKYSPSRFNGLLHKLESKIHLIVALFILTTLLVFGLFTKGIPWLSKIIAYHIPTEIEQQIGQTVLNNIDKLYLSETELSKTIQDSVSHLFYTVTEDCSGEFDFQLEFRKGKIIGANAFALPSGIVIITDELIEMADNGNQLIAVLGHEIGHIVNRHSLRNMFQNYSMLLLISVFAGNSNSVSNLSSSLSQQLIEKKYSRNFEYEADDFAVKYLKKKQIPVHHFADILRKLEALTTQSNDIMNYLSTHPATDQRIAVFSDSSSQN